MGYPLTRGLRRARAKMKKPQNSGREAPPPLYLHLPASPSLRSFCDRARRTIGRSDSDGGGAGESSSPRPGPCETRSMSHFGLSNLRREFLSRTINFASREKIRREYSTRIRAPLARSSSFRFSFFYSFPSPQPDPPCASAGFSKENDPDDRNERVKSPSPAITSLLRE